MEQNCLTFEELKCLPPASYLLVDTRDQISQSYGKIPGSQSVAPDDLPDFLSRQDGEKRIVLYCTKGTFTQSLLSSLKEAPPWLYSLYEGYHGYLKYQMRVQQQEAEQESPRVQREPLFQGTEEKASLPPAQEKESQETGAQEAGVQEKEARETEVQETGAPKKVQAEPSLQERVEKSIRKKFHKQLFTPFAKAIRDYELLSPGDRVAVCISGGKDSMLMAKLFQELRRHDKFPFELVFLCMDPGYSPLNRQLIEHNARILGIPLTLFETDIFDAVDTVEKNPCYLCARMRRGHLYSQAKQLGCNKIALGHHYDDVIETILMGMLYGGQVQTMMPKLHSIHFEGMELIRPMYLIREEDVRHFRDYHQLGFLQCACHFTEACAACGPDEHNLSKRQEIKDLIASLKEKNPSVEANIFRSVENVNLSTCIAYKQNGVRHSFLENYQQAAPQED